MPTPEAKVKQKVVKVLKSYERVWYFFPGNNGFGKSGVPDIVACIDGKFVGIEVKAGPKKEPTKLQALCGRRIWQANGEWFLVRCQEDIDSLEHWMIKEGVI